MNYARVQKEVLAKLTKDPNAVVHCLTTDGRVCYVVDGQIGYIVPSDTNWIAADKIMREVQLTSLRLPSCTSDQLLTQTNSLLDSDGGLLRELHKTCANGRTVQVYIQEKHLKILTTPSCTRSPTPAVASSPSGRMTLLQATSWWALSSRSSPPKNNKKEIKKS